MSEKGRAWCVVRSEVRTELADELAGRLGAGSLGVELREAGPGRTSVLVYVETRDEAERVAADFRELPDDLGIGRGSKDRVSIDTVSDGRWVERYQAALEPRALGARFAVVPDVASAMGDRVSIVMVPGRAFGTGEHPTTRLCAAALESRVEPGSRWLDFGTGSGVLALVAAHCGAARVVAVDVDADAVEVAGKWVARNGMIGRVEVRHAGAESCEEGGFDGVVANVSTPFLLRHPRDLRRALRSGGTLIASGYPSGEAPEVGVALAAAGFTQRSHAIESGWGSMVLRAGEPS